MRREALFVLHIWCESDREEVWRARLEDLRSQETRVFQSLEALTRYLYEHSARRRGSEEKG